MQAHRMALVIAAACLVPATACSGSVTRQPAPAAARSAAATPGVTAATPTTTAPAPKYMIARPSVAATKRAILSMARHDNPKIPIDGVDILSFGRDSTGVWWVQADVKTPSPWEGAQWFASWDGHKWRQKGFGTGVGQGDYSSDIVWEKPDH